MRYSVSKKGIAKHPPASPDAPKKLALCAERAMFKVAECDEAHWTDEGYSLPH